MQEIMWTKKEVNGYRLGMYIPANREWLFALRWKTAWSDAQRNAIEDDRLVSLEDDDLYMGSETAYEEMLAENAVVLQSEKETGVRDLLFALDKIRPACS